MNGIICPKCGSGVERKKVSLQAKLLVGLAKRVVPVDPAPTTFVKKTKNVHRCTNCGFEWTE